ncbi:hypothetical protein AD998_04880 [bacterium 336/3]|nr:hypothetical protein AD998_04880 [bacterium 336/3]
MKLTYALASTLCLALLLSNCKKEAKESEKSSEKTESSQTAGETAKNNDASSSDEEKDATDDDKAVVIAKTGLSLRTKPSGKSKLVTLLPTNTIVKILEEGEEATIKGKTASWYKVQFGKKEGWAFGGYLKKGAKVEATNDADAETEGAGGTETDLSSVVQKGLITAPSGLTLRKAPTPRSEKITVIPQNEEVGILEYMDDSKEIDGVYGVWCRVRYGKKEGFLFSPYINSSTATISAKSGLTLRTEPSKESEKIKVIPFGKEVYIMPATDPNASEPDNVFVDENGGVWYKVRYGKSEGWAFGEFLEMLTEGC